MPSKKARLLFVLSASCLSMFLLLAAQLVSSANNSKLIVSSGSIFYLNEPPLLGGWGGIRLYEVNRFLNENGSSRNTPPSEVFPGEVASNTEMMAAKLVEKGYNTIRVIFESPITDDPNRWDVGFNKAWFEKTLAISKAFDLWVIVDYHAYVDHYEWTQQWLNWWKDSIILPYKDSYDKIVWEPINEPTSDKSGQDAVDQLQITYQQWINMCRQSGDNHWIIVSGVCWWNSLPFEDWFPIVSDPVNKTLLNYHFYYFYDLNSNRWTVEQAQSEADIKYQEVLRVAQKHRRPFIVSEMGAGVGAIDSPDVIYDRFESFSPVSLAFVQRLVERFDNASPRRIGYILWNGGDWGNDLYGCLKFWGKLLTYSRFPQ